MEYTFNFDELTIDKARIVQILGYSGSVLPEPFNSYLETALTELSNI